MQDLVLSLWYVGIAFYAAAACLFLARTGRDLFEDWANDD